MKLDVGHIRTFGCVMHVTLPKEMLGKLEDHGATSYLMGYKYDSGYRVWNPRIGVREVRDVTFYKGTVPVLPNHGSTTEVHRKRHLNPRQQHLHLHHTTQKISTRTMTRRMEC